MAHKMAHLILESIWKYRKINTFKGDIEKNEIRNRRITQCWKKYII